MSKKNSGTSAPEQAETPVELDSPLSLEDAFAGAESPAQEAAAEAQSLVEEDNDGPKGPKRVIPAKPEDPALSKLFNVVAEADLRVVTPSFDVFILTANEPRTLPKRLCLAAQLAGATHGVVVTTTAAE